MAWRRTDWLGFGILSAFGSCVARYPRKNFKESFLRAYFEGFAHKPGTTFGTVNAGVCERFIPGYKSPNASDAMLASVFPDSE